MLEGEPGSFVTLVYANRTQPVGDVPRRGARPQGPLPRPASRSCTCCPARPQEVELLSGRLDGERLRRILDGAGAGRRRRRLVPLRAAADGRRAARGAAPTSGARAGAHRAVPRRPGPARARRRARGRRRGCGARDDPARRPRLDFDLRPDDVPVLEAALRGALRPARSPARAGSAAPAARGWSRAPSQMDANYALEPEEIERGYVLTCQSHPTSARVVARLRRLTSGQRPSTCSPGRAASLRWRVSFGGRPPGLSDGRTNAR